MLETITLIASDPRETALRCRREEDLRELARASLILIVVCTASFGLVVGGVRDSVQALYSGCKLPIMWLASLIFCLPGFYVLSAVFGQSIRLRALSALLLAAMARGALVLFACLPVLWLASDILSSSLAYHQVIVLSAGVYGLAAFAALGTLVRAYSPTAMDIPLFCALALLFVLVSGQTAWSLRPFVGRPSQESVPFVRAPEGTFVGAVVQSSRSARGHYDADY